MLNAMMLPDDAPLEKLKEALMANNFNLVDEVIELMASCHLQTVGAIRMFTRLPELVAELFDTTSRLGQLKAEGYSASLRVILT